MSRQLTADDARQSLTAHVETKGVEIFAAYGPKLDWDGLQRLLADRTQVRYPCEIVFDEALLLPGEFAHPMPKGTTPEDGFTMAVHPLFITQPDRVPALVLYQLVAVNYGTFASSDEAETFGAAALGITRDEYYALLCDCADQLGNGPDAEPVGAQPSGCGGGTCNCGG